MLKRIGTFFSTVAEFIARFWPASRTQDQVLEDLSAAYKEAEEPEVPPIADATPDRRRVLCRWRRTGLDRGYLLDGRVERLHRCQL